MKEKGLDVGFAYDGDADRCLAVDEHGNVIDGDLILYICGSYLKEQGRLKNIQYINPSPAPQIEDNIAPKIETKVIENENKEDE